MLSPNGTTPGSRAPGTCCVTPGLMPLSHPEQVTLPLRLTFLLCEMWVLLEGSEGSVRCYRHCWERGKHTIWRSKGHCWGWAGGGPAQSPWPAYSALDGPKHFLHNALKGSVPRESKK